MMPVDVIRNRLTNINFELRRIKELSEQITVMNALDALVIDVCRLGNDLDKPE